MTVDQVWGPAAERHGVITCAEDGAARQDARFGYFRWHEVPLSDACAAARSVYMGAREACRPTGLVLGLPTRDHTKQCSKYTQHQLTDGSVGHQHPALISRL